MSHPPGQYYISSNSAKLEARSSPQSSYDLLEQCTHNDHEVDMDQQGYEYINSGGINEKALVHSLSVEENALGHPGSSDSAEHLSSADHQQEWQQAMEHGFNVCVSIGRSFHNF